MELKALQDEVTHSMIDRPTQCLYSQSCTTINSCSHIVFLTHKASIYWSIYCMYKYIGNQQQKHEAKSLIIRILTIALLNDSSLDHIHQQGLNLTVFLLFSYRLCVLLFVYVVLEQQYIYFHYWSEFTHLLLVECSL